MNQTTSSPQKHAKPFLKWAGGKGQLLDPIAANIPPEFTAKKFTYIEPFVGSGAVLFWMIAHFPTLDKIIINDINEELIGCYRTIITHPHQLIEVLENWQSEFYALEDNPTQKQNYYYAKRDLYNTHSENPITQSALFIFLNRTCFNGLYRVNRKGIYNVPMGTYKKPKICDHNNILAVSQALKEIEILCGDYTQTLRYAHSRSFFYLDPPYKPLSQTANFTSYTKGSFNDDEQIRLHTFCQQLDKCGCKWVLSNSDASDQNSPNMFFDTLYSGFNIVRVKANRRISAKSSTRGLLNELIIRNY